MYVTGIVEIAYYIRLLATLAVVNCHNNVFVYVYIMVCMQLVL